MAFLRLRDKLTIYDPALKTSRFFGQFCPVSPAAIVPVAASDMAGIDDRIPNLRTVSRLLRSLLTDRPEPIESGD